MLYYSFPQNHGKNVFNQRPILIQLWNWYTKISPMRWIEETGEIDFNPLFSLETDQRPL